MPKLDTILRQIRTRKKPFTLKGGLTLRMERQNHMMMLVAWRMGKSPSDTEMGVLVKTVKRVFDPIIILRSEKPEQNGRMLALRLYWTAEPVWVSWLKPANGCLFEEE